MTTDFRLIAHRGASAHAPENTIAAFERALLLGADEIELDVRFSADEEIVVFHDDHLAPKTHLQGRVRHYDAATLERTDLAPWFCRTHPEESPPAEAAGIPRLETVLAAFAGSVQYHIEIKGWDDLLPLSILRMVDRYGLSERVTITSFSLRPLLEIRRLAPEIPITFLLRDAADALRSAEFRTELEQRDLAAVHAYWIATAARSGFQHVGVRAEDVTAETVACARSEGLALRGWGVRDEADLLHLVECGAIGATVDWPGRARATLERSRTGPTHLAARPR
jgi:glycerophosphoryl diester phosphodiesterase